MIKNGAPRRAVKIPTGSSAGIAAVLAKVSANNNRMPPSIIDAGITFL
jgi:hypothetical protein